MTVDCTKFCKINFYFNNIINFCLKDYIYGVYLTRYKTNIFLYTLLSVTGPFNNKTTCDFMQYGFLNAICFAGMDLHLR
jgi:hypothetical protein